MKEIAFWKLTLNVQICCDIFQGGDLDFKIQEYKDSGKMFTQTQVIDWFIQLLLGVNYMHERYSHLIWEHSAWEESEWTYWLVGGIQTEMKILFTKLL